MEKAIMPALKDLKLQINKTNEQLASQYRMMSSAHNRYNFLFRHSQNANNTSFHLITIQELFNYTSG